MVNRRWSAFGIHFRLLGALGLLAACLVLGGCGKPAESSARKGGGGPSSQAEVAKPAFAGTAEQFATEFARDKDAAEKKYKDQVVELEGPVMDPKLTGEAISLFGNYNKADRSDKEPTILISCSFVPAKQSQMEGLKSKQNVKVRGKVARTNPAGVDLIECDIFSK